MLTYVLPTHDRPRQLAATIAALGRLPAHDAEVIVVDNASTPPVSVAWSLANGLPVRVLRRDTNEAAAGRNAGVAEARGTWVVMLDDDSWPVDVEFLSRLDETPDDVAAVGAEIVLPDGRREAGGLPEVFVGCGVAIRRDAYLDAGGYDPSFGYYVEEYDLSARLLAAGWRIVHDRRFRVRHEKVADGRDMNLILERLVRNNAWVAQRYAPDDRREAELAEVLERYRGIATKEAALDGYRRGLGQLEATLAEQPRQPLDEGTYDRFTGLAAVQRTLESTEVDVRGRGVAVVDRGKNAWAVAWALAWHGAVRVHHARDADLLAIGTLSPGPMWDAWERRRERGEPVIASWIPYGATRPTHVQQAI
jgi:GT2 family glycosyltransferase